MADAPNPTKGGLAELWPQVDTLLKAGKPFDKRVCTADVPSGVLHLYVWPKGQGPKGPLVEQQEEEEFNALKTYGPPVAAAVVAGLLGYFLGRR